MSDPAIVAEEIASMIGAHIDRYEDELTGEVSLSMETDDQGVSATGPDLQTAYKNLVREADQVGWRLED
jgi:hypothetical protein